MSRRDFIICFHLFKGIFHKTWKFLPCLGIPSPLRRPLDNRVTASRLRRLRVLLTGRHGNLATSLQWPKVDGLRAGAPEQTEQKSVHARTRNRTCYVRRALSLSFSSLSLSRTPLALFFSLLSPCRFPDRIANYRPRVRVDGVCVLYPGHPDSRRGPGTPESAEVNR